LPNTTADFCPRQEQVTQMRHNCKLCVRHCDLWS